MKKKSVLYLLFVVLWCSFIFLLSDTPSKESNKASKSVIETTTIETVKRTNDLKITNINTNDKKWKNKIVNQLNTPVRKIAHGVIYFVLSIIFFLLLRSMKIDSKKAILWTIAFCFLYSTTDEIHQTFVLERSGRLLDCLIDTLGAILGSIFIYKLLPNKGNIKV